ncbi:MAG: hypothetical protein QM820_37635 [Minicystis sp.]
MLWSDEARVMVRPFRAYADLAAAGDDRPARTAAARALFFLFVSGAFVSLTAAGRLVAFHVVSTMVFWSFIPAVQAAVLLGTLRVVGAHPRSPGERAQPSGAQSKPSSASALALYFAGHGPWMMFFLLLAGICLFVPDVHATMMWLLRRGVIPALMLTTIIWSMVLTYACFREGIGLPRGRARGATALFYGGFTVVIVGYYLAMNEIQPQLPWAP